MIVIVIPAKGHSNRLPNKNMNDVAGKPMLDWSIDFALQSKMANVVYVSTDSDDIEQHCANKNIKVIRRPETLGGETPIIDVYKHAIENMPDGESVSILVGLQPDHPDRTVSIDETISMLQKEQADRIMSKEPDGTKSGAHYVLSRHYLDTEESRKDITIVDDCTNIHFVEDLEKANGILTARHLKK